MKTWIPISFIILLPFFSFSQPNFPDPGEVFFDEIVPRVDIFIDPDTLDWIYDNVESFQEFHAVFIFDNGNILDTIDNVGFRLRGNTSRYSAKKSFKISFNTFEPGRKWYGLEKLNLNGEHNDPSIIRAKLCWDLLNDFNIPGARSNHVEVYINNNYYGLYINVEHIDEEFVKSRFGNNDGNLFKCLWPVDLVYFGTNPDLYKFTVGDRRAYDLKTNKEEDDYSDLAHFIDILNNTPDNQFLCELEKVFNVYDYLKVIAVDVFTGNWDGYIYNKNNFYLYHNTETGKFEYIPYDLDNTYGIDWIGRDWGTRDIYDWQQHGDQYRPLYERIMENEELKDQYSFYVNKLITELVVPDTYFQYIDQIKNMMVSYVANDPYYPLDYGYTIGDFFTSFDDALWGHVAYGLKPYISTRRANASFQLQLNDINPVIRYLKHNRPLIGEDFWIRAFVEDEDPSPQVKLAYTINGGSLQNKLMYDDGDHNDGEAGDMIYGCIFLDIQVNTTISYQISAEDNFGYTSLMPCEPIFFEFIESENPLLFINEFMASNDSTIADEHGEYDDWIEIYNGDENPVWLGDKYLSDNLQNYDKWQMPDLTLQPGDFILIWADNDEEQGPNHTNFKLNKDGEEIGIFDAEITGFYLLDSIIFGPQTTDISYGLNPDGCTNWFLYNEPTPGYSNVTGAVIYEQHNPELMKIILNQGSGSLIEFEKVKNMQLFNDIAQLLLQKDKKNSIEISPLGERNY